MAMIDNRYKISTLDPQMNPDSMIFKIPLEVGGFKYIGTTKEVFHKMMYDVVDDIDQPFVIKDGATTTPSSQSMIDRIKGYTELFYKYEFDNSTKQGIWMRITDDNISDIRNEILDFLYNGEGLPSHGYMNWLYKLQTKDEPITHSNPLENFKTRTQLSTYDKFSDPYNVAFINNVFNLSLIGLYYYETQNITNLMEIEIIPQIDEYYYMYDAANNVIGIKQYMAKDNMVDLSSLMGISASIVTTPLLSTFRYQVNIKDSVLLAHLTNEHPEWCYQIKSSLEDTWNDRRHHNDYYYRTDKTPNATNKYDIRLYADVDATEPIIYMTDIFQDLSVQIIT